MSSPDFVPALVTARSDRARQCVWTGRGPVLLENRDLITTVWLGQDEGMDPGGADTVPLDPLGSKSMTGSNDVWCMTQSGTAVVASIPGASGSQVSPLLIAEQIAASGTPLLGGIDFLKGPNATVTVAAASSQAVKVTFFKPGYVISINSAIGVSTATIPFIDVSLNWQDASSLVSLDYQNWVVPSTYSGTYVIRGTGPVRGPNLTITFKNLDPANAVTITYSVVESTQYTARDDWRGPIGGPGTAGLLGTNQWSPGTGTQANCDISAGILQSVFSGSVPANTELDFVLPLYCGQVNVNLSGVSALTTGLRIPTCLPAVGYGGNAPLFLSSVNFESTFAFPRVPIMLAVQNTTASPISYSAFVNLLEHVSLRRARQRARARQSDQQGAQQPQQPAHDQRRCHVQQHADDERGRAAVAAGHSCHHSGGRRPGSRTQPSSPQMPSQPFTSRARARASRRLTARPPAGRTRPDPRRPARRPAPRADAPHRHRARGRRTRPPSPHGPR